MLRETVLMTQTNVILTSSVILRYFLEIPKAAICPNAGNPSVRYGDAGDSFWNKRENGSMLGVAIDRISYCLKWETERSEE